MYLEMIGCHQIINIFFTDFLLNNFLQFTNHYCLIETLLIQVSIDTKFFSLKHGLGLGIGYQPGSKSQLRKTFGDFSVFLSSWWKKQESPCLLPRLVKKNLKFATMVALLVQEERGTNIPVLGNCRVTYLAFLMASSLCDIALHGKMFLGHQL